MSIGRHQVFRKKVTNLPRNARHECHQGHAKIMSIVWKKDTAPSRCRLLSQISALPDKEISHQEVRSHFLGGDRKTERQVGNLIFKRCENAKRRWTVSCRISPHNERADRTSVIRLSSHCLSFLGNSW